MAEENKLDEELNNENLEENEDETPSTEEEETLEGIEEGIVPSLTERDLTKEVKNDFIEYAMSVIVSRALPDVRDGLKPVHRRIVYGMNELGNGPDKPHKKSARIVGDVMGRFHPHGDSSIYGALVRLAQNFNTRYPLVDGHGNFGSIDGDGAAAMRYTEARMSKIALEMVRDIKKDTVDFIDNYDGEEQEPVVLPSRIPNLIVNGSSGIAVGMATNIPPHNLTEAINAVQALIKDPNLTPSDIMNNYLFGPDFPTGGIILGRSGIKDAYETGTGSITIRSKAHIEEMANGKNRIVVSEIPYQVNKATMIENIGHLVRDKVIDGITDIRDESNKEGIRIVIELRKDVVPEVILNQLYKNTSLQTGFGIIMLVVDNGEPKVLNIKEILSKYLSFQCEVIERRTRFDLGKAQDRLHILEGLLKAIDNIDETVNIIRSSKTQEIAKSRLIERFSYSDAQVKAILDLRLARLVGLERDSIVDEINTLKESIAYYNSLLSDHTLIEGVVNDELEEIKQKYGDKRRTEISNAVSSIDDEDLIPEEEIIITLTKSGYIKRQDPDAFRSQHRGGKGVKGMSTHDDDMVEKIVYAKTHTDLLFFTSLGKVYRIRGYQVPFYSKNSKGLPIVNLLSLEENEKVRSIISLDEYKENEYLFFATVNGIVKRCDVKEFESIRQNGKKAIEMKEGDELLDVKLTNGEALVSISASNGKMVKFNENDVRVMGRSASGVKGIDIEDDVKALSLTTSLEGNLVLVISEKGYGKLSPLEDYRLTSRGSKGVITMNMTEKTGNLISTKSVNGDEDVMIITKGGMIIRTYLGEVKVAGRNTQGVKIINIKDKESVVSLTIVPHVEEVSEEAPTTQNEENVVVSEDNKENN